MLKTDANRDMSVTYFLLNFEDLWEPIFYLILNVYGICRFRMLESSPHWETCSLSFEINLIKVSLYNLKKLWNKRFYFSLINKRNWHHHHYNQPAPKSFVDGRSINVTFLCISNGGTISEWYSVDVSWRWWTFAQLSAEMPHIYLSIM